MATFYYWYPGGYAAFERPELPSKEKRLKAEVKDTERKAAVLSTTSKAVVK